MEKVYWLLRNNIESGPYSIDELLKQQLNSSDLIWIEGESAAWFYPGEIEELGETKKKNDLFASPESTNIMRSDTTGSRRRLPPDKEIEWMAEQLRKRALSYKPAHQPGTKIQYNNEGESSYHLDLINKEPVNLIYHKEKRNSHLPEVLGMLLLILAIAWYGGLSPFNQKRNIVEPAAIQFVASKKYSKKISSPPAQHVIIPVPENVSLTTTESDSNMLALNAVSIVKEKPKSKPLKKPITHVDPVLPVAAVEPDIKPQDKDDLALPPAPIQKALNEEDKSTTSVVSSSSNTAEATEKKKSFGMVLKGLFKKRKREEDKQTTDSSKSPDMN